MKNLQPARYLGLLLLFLLLTLGTAKLWTGRRDANTLSCLAVLKLDSAGDNFLPPGSGLQLLHDLTLDRASIDGQVNKTLAGSEKLPDLEIRLSEGESVREKTALTLKYKAGDRNLASRLAERVARASNAWIAAKYEAGLQDSLKVMNIGLVSLEKELLQLEIQKKQVGTSSDNLQVKIAADIQNKENAYGRLLEQKEATDLKLTQGSHPHLSVTALKISSLGEKHDNTLVYLGAFLISSIAPVAFAWKKSGLVKALDHKAGRPVSSPVLFEEITPEVEPLEITSINPEPAPEPVLMPELKEAVIDIHRESRNRLVNQPLPESEPVLKRNVVATVRVHSSYSGQQRLAASLVQEKNIARQFQMLRSQLRVQGLGSGKKKFFVTSDISAQGKKIIALELAKSFASDGHETLLLGSAFDMDYPGLKFRPANFSGQNQDWLPDQLEAKTSSNLSNLTFISQKELRTGFSGTLSKMDLFGLLLGAAPIFSYIIIDETAVEHLADKPFISSLCDASLFVIDKNQVPRAVIENVSGMRGFEPYHNPIVVFNDVSKKPVHH